MVRIRQSCYKNRRASIDEIVYLGYTSPRKQNYFVQIAQGEKGG